MDEVGAPEDEARPGSATMWWLAALAFFLGVALCALVVAVGELADGRDGASAGPREARTQVPRAAIADRAAGDVLVRLPSSCLAALNAAEETVRELDDLAGAARRFEARRLQEIVDRFQQLQPEIEEQADTCRDETAGRVQSDTFVTKAPSVTASP